MSDVPLLASAYAVFLAIAAALLARVSPGRAAGSWPHDEVPRLRRAIAGTLLVLSSVVLVVVAARHGSEANAAAYVGSAAVVVLAVVGTARRR